MLSWAIVSQHHALNLLFYIFGTVSSTNTVNLKLPEWGNPNESIKKASFPEEELTIALMKWNSPKVSETDLENSWKDSQDEPNCTGHIKWADFSAKDPPLVPLSPGLQDILLQLKNDFFPISSSSSLVSNRNSCATVPALDIISNSHTRLHQTPQASGNPTKLMIQDDTMNYIDRVLKGGQLCSIEPSSNPSMNDMSHQLPAKPSRKRAADEYLSPKQKVTGRISQQYSIDGYRSILHLKYHYDKFCKTLKSIDSIKTTSQKKYQIPYPELRLGICFINESYVAIKILKFSMNCVTEKQDVFQSYYSLIKWIFVLYEEYLKGFSISVFMYIHLQQRILNWVDSEIFGSDNESYRIMGIRSLSEFKWSSEHQFRDTQIKLINYFSKGDQELALSTATYLLKTFQVIYPSELK
ncbi:hypothetical protein PGT21_035033 [Puccinia graminis f. sp. tritici]|uniref:Uncharacterized protein n=1 Tax=Puccinia graminis f. sp. tritici TaxID=56615 RepID=A0A5B0QDF6_PUCGR|nr:hypothetical protein PGT21_035033 [Puccinia graminis f. sp. tritici]